MNDALDVGPGRVDGRVQLVAGDLHAKVGRALLDDAALHVGLHETRGRHLVVQKTIGIDEEVLLVLVETGSDQATDALRPAVQVEQPEDSGELAAQQLLALCVAHTLDASNIVYWYHAIRI